MSTIGDPATSRGPGRTYRKRRMDKPTGCDIDWCERPHGTNGLCAAHYIRLLQYGDPLAGPPMRKPRRPSGGRIGPQTEYQANHTRVRKARGAAWQQPCERCDKDAKDWATIHGKSGKDPADYMPLCRSCHLKYDMEGKPGRTAGRVQPPEERARRSLAMLKRYEDPVEREKTRQANLQRFTDPEERQKMRQAALVRWSRTTS